MGACDFWVSSTPLSSHLTSSALAVLGAGRTRGLTPTEVKGRARSCWHPALCPSCTTRVWVSLNPREAGLTCGEGQAGGQWPRRSQAGQRAVASEELGRPAVVARLTVGARSGDTAFSVAPGQASRTCSGTLHGGGPPSLQEGEAHGGQGPASAPWATPRTPRLLLLSPLLTTPTSSLHISSARPGLDTSPPLVQEATGPAGARAINNLRRCSSTTQVHQPQAGQAWTSPLR